MTLATLLDYHDRTKHHLHAYARCPGLGTREAPEPVTVGVTLDDPRLKTLHPYFHRGNA